MIFAPNSIMKHLFAVCLLLVGLSSAARNTTYTQAIGNWRNGPVVYITPLWELPEQKTDEQLKEMFRAAYIEFMDIQDDGIKVLRFETKQRGNRSVISSEREYGYGKHKVVRIPDPQSAEDAP